MNRYVTVACLFFAGMILSTASCKKETAAEPQWFGEHTRFYYDLETDSTVEERSWLLSVRPQSNGREWFFDARPADTGVGCWYSIFGIFGNGMLKLRPDGICNHASNTCNVGLVSTSFDFLMIPAEPQQGAKIPQYAGEHRDDGENEILSSDTLISVPAGNFHTFCVLHTNGDRSWWNRDIGIIMYRAKSYGIPFPTPKSCTLRLRSMN